MTLTDREFWTLVHGMFFGAIFLLAFAGGLADLWALRDEWETKQGLRKNLKRLVWGTWVMALAAWGTVVTGTYTVYPWYRAAPPQGADLSDFPRSFLLSKPETAAWHTFGMEWKEHVAWISPILATVVAFIVWRFQSRLSHDPALRKMVLVLYVVAFFTAGVAGLFGALITKVAPIL